MLFAIMTVQHPAGKKRYWFVARVKTFCCLCWRIGRIKFLESSSFTALRASEPFTFNFSEMIEGVISFNLGTSLSIFSYVTLSKRTRLASFSFTLPLLHFFFFALPPPEPPALDLAAFLSSFLGAILPGAPRRARELTRCKASLARRTDPV